MLETYYAGVYWGPRKETAEECARRLARFLQGLAACDTSFERWFQPGRAPRNQPGCPLPPGNLVELEGFLLRGRHYTDTDRQVIEELGFRGTAWNERRNAAHLNLLCGCHASSPCNSWVVALPTEGQVAERLSRAPVLAQVLTTLMTAWEADWGVVTSDDLRECLSPRGQAGTFAGWLTYVSRQRGTVPPLPAPARIEPVGSLGTLVILTPERPTASNPEHVRLLTCVHRLMDEAGLLHPICS